MTDWSDPLPTTNVFCDEIDEIMKQEHEDVVLIDDSLYPTPLDFDLDSMSDLLPNQSSPATSCFTQPLNITDLTPTSGMFNNNNSHSIGTTGTSGYSSSDISPKFITLTIDNNHLQQFIQSNNLSISSIVQQQQQQQQSEQQENDMLGRSYPFERQNNMNESLDVKRFRSASMNEGPMLQQQPKLGSVLVILFYNRFKD